MYIFSDWIYSCNPYPYYKSNILISPESSLVTLLRHLQWFLCVLKHHINGIIQYAFCVSFFSLCIMFIGYICILVCICSSLLFFHWVLFHCMNISQLVYRFFSWWTLGLFPDISYCEKKCCNNHSYTCLLGDIWFNFSCANKREWNWRIKE